MNKKRLVFILGNLTSFGPFITDFYLPCLPELTAYFGGSASLIQLSLTAGMLGLAAVLLGSTWHYIDTAGRTRLSFPGCEAVKPFRNGRAQVVRSGRRIEIDRAGREFPVPENEFAV